MKTKKKKQSFSFFFFFCNFLLSFFLPPFELFLTEDGLSWNLQEKNLDMKMTLKIFPSRGQPQLLPWTHDPLHRFLSLIIYCEMIEANNIRIYLEITFQLSIKN